MTGRVGDSCGMNHVTILFNITISFGSATDSSNFERELKPFK